MNNNFFKNNKKEIEKAYQAGLHYGALKTNKTAWQCYTEWAEKNQLSLLSKETFYFFNQFEFGFNIKKNSNNNLTN